MTECTVSRSAFLRRKSGTTVAYNKSVGEPEIVTGKSDEIWFLEIRIRMQSRGRKVKSRSGFNPGKDHESSSQQPQRAEFIFGSPIITSSEVNMNGFRKILCPIDFSDYSTVALRYASALARENKAQIVVCHLIPDLTQAINYLEGNYVGTVHEALITSATAKFEEFVQKNCPDLPITKVIGQGNASEWILRLAQEHQADLIVMGTHGHTGYERFFLGSVTNRVLHKTTVPVLTICKPSHNFLQESSAHPVQIKRILCPLDFDANNHAIVDTALSLGRQYKARLLFVHVISNKEKVDWPAAEKEAQDSFHKILDPQMSDDCEIDFFVHAGEPGNIILRMIDSHNIDLLVMGHHSRKPIEELFLGSVAKRMVTDAACPVLVARTTADSRDHNLVLI